MANSSPNGASARNGLTIAGLDAGYGSVRVLEDISLSVSHAETVVLLGTNGNGKSTLMKCVMGMLRPTTGSIIAEIDGASTDFVLSAIGEELGLLGTVAVCMLFLLLVGSGFRVAIQTERPRSSPRRPSSRSLHRKAHSAIILDE